MHSLTVFQGHHTQVFPQFCDKSPIPDTAVRLYFAVNGMQQGSLTPFSPNVGTLSQDLLFEAASRLHPLALPVRLHLVYAITKLKPR